MSVENPATGGPPALLVNGKVHALAASQSSVDGDSPTVRALATHVSLKRGDKPERCSSVAKPTNTCGCGALSAPNGIGPFIRCTGYQPSSDSWTGTVLYACHPEVSEAPTVSWVASGGSSSPTVVPGVCLDTYCQWNFWRFELDIPVAQQQQSVKYWVNGNSGDASTFYVAARDQPWHWAYYSCNGFTPDVPREDANGKWGGITPLWDDLVARHNACPMHALVGGGDQLYNDDVLTCPALQAFFGCAEPERPGVAFSQEMEQEVEEYYFHHYAVHLSFSSIGAAMRSIPSVMSWDDHDIFDGWGSYPEPLHNSAVFQGIYTAARRFFLLFQLHTTPQRAHMDGCFGKKAYNQLVLFGPRVALALPDCRSQRTEDQVLSLDTHMSLIIKIEELPSSVRHLVLGTTVPVVYPHLKGGEAILTTLGRLNKNKFMHSVFKATGIASAVFNDVDEPELLDDLRDHWSAKEHSDERRFLIEHLQMLAKAKRLRCSIISGDVHLAATGRLYSHPKHSDLASDFRYMPQIVCSAIGNAPPPDGLVKLLHIMGRAGFVNKATRAKMCKLFNNQGKFRMLNRRNWCEVWEVPEVQANYGATLPAIPGNQAAALGSLVFDLRVEDFITSAAVDRHVEEFATVVPPIPGGGRPVHGQFNVRKGASRKALQQEDSPGHKGHAGAVKQTLRVGDKVVQLEKPVQHEHGLHHHHAAAAAAAGTVSTPKAA